MGHNSNVELEYNVEREMGFLVVVKLWENYNSTLKNKQTTKANSHAQKY
jgi:hypothetical protein